MEKKGKKIRIHSIEDLDTEKYYPACDLARTIEYSSAYQLNTIYHQIYQGNLLAIRFGPNGKRWMVKGEDFLNFIAGN